MGRTSPNSGDDEVGAWVARAPAVPSEWFVRESRLHGVTHTQRVHIHAQRLADELGWTQADTGLVLAAALWHDIGRTKDDVDPGHGALSAARAADLRLPHELAPNDAAAVLFAIRFHSLSDASARDQAARWHDAGAPGGARRLAKPERALSILWLLKDADALDRVRLAPWEAADPRQLRHDETRRLMDFAARLYVRLY
jgi:putative nucleotidyltransferase with HDIG domain